MNIKIANIKALTEIVDDVRAMQQRADNALFLIADSIKDETKSRIQNGGQATNGSGLKTSAPKRLGAYSEMWGKKRSKSGLQTSHVDLTFSGKLMADYVSVSLSKSRAQIKFNTLEEANIAGYMESQYGTPIFDPSDHVINKHLEKYSDIVIGV